MTRRGPRRGWIVPALVFTFVAGGVAGWLLRAPATPAVLSRSGDLALPTGTARATAPASGVDRPLADPVISSGDPLDALRAKDLRLPLDNADVASMRGQFGDRRDGGARGHEAVDLLAPRGTPIHAVDAGRIARLFLSRLGGITIYQYDPTGRFCYYYAHLERYADDLREGQPVARGDIIGYVGTSGNAPPDTPHLHFAVFELTADRHWWEGTALDPWQAFSR